MGNCCPPTRSVPTLQMGVVQILLQSLNKQCNHGKKGKKYNGQPLPADEVGAGVADGGRPDPPAEPEQAMLPWIKGSSEDQKYNGKQAVLRFIPCCRALRGHDMVKSEIKNSKSLYRAGD